MLVDHILYHANCPDGFCAAYVAHTRWPHAVLVPVTHGEPLYLNRHRDRHVLVLDFSWKRPLCEELAGVCASLTIIDHHKTAQQELAGLSYATFDMSRSGATMAWDILIGGSRPWYVTYVEDRDLARYALPDSKAVSAYIMALPQTVEAWSRLSALSLEYVKTMGAAIRLHIEQYVTSVCAERQSGMIGGHHCSVVNAPFQNIGDICAALTQYTPIGLGWFERGDKQLQFSLRSNGSLVDVSAIAQTYGGGGHTAAAGFQLPYRQGYAVLHYILGRLSDHDRTSLHIDRLLNRHKPLSPGVAQLLEYPTEVPHE